MSTASVGCSKNANPKYRVDIYDTELATGTDALIQIRSVGFVYPLTQLPERNYWWTAK